jgi:hypothetical protein
MSKRNFNPLQLWGVTADPGSPSEGDGWHRTDLHQARYYDGDLVKGLGIDSVCLPMVNPGYWYALCGYSTTGGSSTFSTVSGTEYAMPLVCGLNGTRSGIAVNVGTGVAATTLRAGIRADSGSCTPVAAAPLYDGGTVTSTTSSQVRTWAPSLAIVAGRIYWVTITPQGGAPGITGQSIAHPLIGITTTTPVTTDITTGSPGAYAASGAGQGALPSAYTITGVVAGSLKILVKFSAASR